MTQYETCSNDFDIRLKQTVPRSNWCCYSCVNDVRGSPGYNIIEGTQEKYFTGYNKNAKTDIIYTIRYNHIRDAVMCKDCFIKHIDGMKDFFDKLSNFKDMEDEHELIPYLDREAQDEESK